MIDEKNVLYLRFILLLIQGGTEVLRRITEKALKKKKITLCPFLSSVKNTLMGSKDLHEKQKELLFPSSSTSPNINDFDITLLSFIILHYFKDVLDGNDRNAARQIRDIRNKYHAHANSLNMTLATFTKEWTKLSNIIYSVSQGMPDKDKQELLDILDNVNDDQFQLKTAIEELKNIDTSNDFYGSIKEKLEKIELCQKEMATDVKDIKTEQIHQRGMIAEVEKRTLEMREELKAIERHLENKGKITTLKNITYGNVHANADDQETTEEANSCLLRASEESLKNKEGKEYTQSELKEKTDGFIEDVEKRGVKLTGVKEGSVVFEFTCFSLDALIDLLDYFCSSCFKARLDAMALALEHVVGKKVDLLGFIDLESLQNVITKLHFLEQERIVQFEMECAGVDGLLHVLDVFEEDKTTNSLKELSKALSETVKKPVTLHTSIDLDQMQRAIDSLKEHIALEDANETGRRNESCGADSGLEGGIRDTIKQTDKEFPDKSLEAELSETQENGESLAEANMKFPGPKQPPFVERPKQIPSEYPDDQKELKTKEADRRRKEDEGRLERENMNLEQQIHRLESQNEILQEEKQKAKDEKQLIERQKKDLEKTVTRLEEELENEKRKEETACYKVQKLEVENRHLKMWSEEAEKENKRFEGQIGELKKKVRLLETKPEKKGGAAVGAFGGAVGAAVGEKLTEAAALVGSLFSRQK